MERGGRVGILDVGGRNGWAAWDRRRVRRYYPGDPGRHVLGLPKLLPGSIMSAVRASTPTLVLSAFCLPLIPSQLPHPSPPFAPPSCPLSYPSIRAMVTPPLNSMNRLCCPRAPPTSSPSCRTTWSRALRSSEQQGGRGGGVCDGSSGGVSGVAGTRQEQRGAVVAEGRQVTLGRGAAVAAVEA